MDRRTFTTSSLLAGVATVFGFKGARAADGPALIEGVERLPEPGDKIRFLPNSGFYPGTDGKIDSVVFGEDGVSYYVYTLAEDDCFVGSSVVERKDFDVIAKRGEWPEKPRALQIGDRIQIVNDFSANYPPEDPRSHGIISDVGHRLSGPKQTCNICERDLWAMEDWATFCAHIPGVTYVNKTGEKVVCTPVAQWTRQIAGQHGVITEKVDAIVAINYGYPSVVTQSVPGPFYSVELDAFGKDLKLERLAPLDLVRL